MVMHNQGRPAGWQPPRWLFSVVAILIVAWWLSTQPPPRGAAPPPDPATTLEPANPVAPEVLPTAIDQSPAQQPTNVDLGPPVSSADEAPRENTRADDAPIPTGASRAPPATTKKSAAAAAAKKAADDPLMIPKVTIKEQSGRVAFQGKIDLHPTFERIERGEKFPHRNDGSTFRNLEGRLPKKPAGYYTEYVHPTPGINGPGPQRVVIGKQGEAYYTHDHYNSFRKVRE